MESLRADFHTTLRETQAENNRRFDRLFLAIVGLYGVILEALAAAVVALVLVLL